MKHLHRTKYTHTSACNIGEMKIKLKDVNFLVVILCNYYPRCYYWERLQKGIYDHSVLFFTSAHESIITQNKKLKIYVIQTHENDRGTTGSCPTLALLLYPMLPYWG